MTRALPLLLLAFALLGVTVPGGSHGRIIFRTPPPAPGSPMSCNGAALNIEAFSQRMAHNTVLVQVSVVNLGNADEDPTAAAGQVMTLRPLPKGSLVMMPFAPLRAHERSKPWRYTFTQKQYTQVQVAWDVPGRDTLRASPCEGADGYGIPI